jgi:hypothetical protein
MKTELLKLVWILFSIIFITCLYITLNDKITFKLAIKTHTQFNTVILYQWFCYNLFTTNVDGPYKHLTSKNTSIEQCILAKINYCYLVWQKCEHFCQNCQLYHGHIAFLYIYYKEIEIYNTALLMISCVCVIIILIAYLSFYFRVVVTDERIGFCLNKHSVCKQSFYTVILSSFKNVNNFCKNTVTEQLTTLL